MMPCPGQDGPAVDGVEGSAGDLQFVQHVFSTLLTLCHLAESGPDDFYRGDLARRMAADLQANGSFVTADDLATYTLREEMSVTGSYRGYTVTSAAAPHGALCGGTVRDA